MSVKQFSVISAMLWAIIASGALQFPNPSLDEDVANIGVPDGWKIPKTTAVKLVTDKVTHGRKAARFDDGYVLMFCDLEEQNLPGLNLQISFDAAGSDGAELGVIVGYNRAINGKITWGNSTIIWGRKLQKDYEKINLSLRLPDNAAKERIYFGVYRSNKTGVVWLDNFNLAAGRGKALSADEQKAQTIMARDWGYLQSQAEQALRIRNDHPELVAVKQDAAAMMQKIASGEAVPGSQEIHAALLTNRSRLNRALLDSVPYAAWLGDAYKRAEPDEIVPQHRTEQMRLVTLGAEYQAFGLSLANALNEPQTVTIAIDGSEPLCDEINIRRQVFMTHWYQKEKALIADPLTLLPQDNRHWSLTLAPGAIEKLYLSFKVKSGISGQFPLQIKVGNVNLQVTVEAVAANLPNEPFFANFQCMYPNLPPAGRHPELTAKDLAEHYTTGIEFPWIPKVKFNGDGSIAEEDFKGSNQNGWLRTYAREKIRLGLFWEGGYQKFPTVPGKQLPFVAQDKLMPEWQNAYGNLLAAWLKFAAQEGFGEENFLVWCMDELGSKEEFANPPGSKVRIGIEVYKLAQKTAPKVPRMITAGFYTMPEDVAAFIPYVDIILPHWPMPENLARWAPKDYNPRKLFFEKTLPLLKAEREKRGLAIWSYKVDAGKKEPELNARVYPICAVGLGFTGVGSWAYNCSSGATWDDTDGGILDYIFVYNGEEKHPLNLQYNTTGEIIVPSIRWEAFRMGIQDAKILLYLKGKAESNECDPATAEEIKKLLQEAEAYGMRMDYSRDAINRISTRLRELMEKIK